MKKYIMLSACLLTYQINYPGLFSSIEKSLQATGETIKKTTEIPAKTIGLTDNKALEQQAINNLNKKYGSDRVITRKAVNEEMKRLKQKQKISKKQNLSSLKSALKTEEMQAAKLKPIKKNS